MRGAVSSAVQFGAAMALSLVVFTGCEARSGAVSAPAEVREAAEPALPAVATPPLTTDQRLAAIDRAVETAERTRGLGAPALWTLSDEDTSIHLFGTVHLLRPETKWRSTAFETAFAAAETLVLEVDATTPAAQAEMQNLIPQYGLFTDGRTLSTVLDADARSSVFGAAEKIGVPAAALESFKPWLVNLQLGLTQIQRAGFDPNAGLEMVLTEDAKAAGKSFKFLETAEEQIRVLAG
ncbi:MAG: TraB/GumN family protein, partial [Pseudomonadota bacterium]